MRGSIDLESIEIEAEAETKPDKKEIKEIKTKIQAVEKTLKRLQRKLIEAEKHLNSPDSYNHENGQNFHDLLRDQVNLASQIETTEQEWLDLNQALEESS